MQVTSVAGGLANTSARLQLDDPNLFIFLRVMVRDPAQAKKELRLNSLLQTTDVPVPKIYALVENSAVIQQPYILMEWIDGVRLEVLVKERSEEEVALYGSSIGTTLANIHAVKFDQFGFFDWQLQIKEPLDMGGNGLIDFANRILNVKNREKLGQTLSDQLLRLLDQQAPVLDMYKGKPCLTHSDFGGSNILVSPSAPYTVQAVLDWEFAFSGTPFFDFGNLFRPPLGQNYAFINNVIRAYSDAGGELPRYFRMMSTITDITAWLDFLDRAEAGSKLLEDVRAVIGQLVAQWLGLSAED